MKEKILYKKDIPKFYEALVNDYNFYAPTKSDGNIAFKKIDDPKNIELEYFNSKVPPKEILFPQMETIFEYKLEGKETEIIERPPINKKNLLFGIRPCDAYSFQLLKNFFDFGKFKDDLFLEKKENTVIIGIGCNTPRQTCFCTSVEGNPFKMDDSDIFLVDLGDKYLIKNYNEKGKAIIDNLSWLGPAEEKDLEEAMKLENDAQLHFQTKLDVEKAIKVLDGNFENPIWKEISETCMGCGSCSFLCPTCHCFDVIDETDQYTGKGRRIRVWDTCQFCLYTLHTSGHNPRNGRIERCRNRLLHKFSYYPENYNLIGCVGCGRCIGACPVNNDVREIITKINCIEENQEEEEIIASQ